MHSDKIFDAIETIAATSSRTQKEALLAEHLEDTSFREAVRAAYNPFVTYGVAGVSYVGQGSSEFGAAGVGALLDDLASRRLTGNRASDEIRDTMKVLSPRSAELLCRILNRDLRAGFTSGSVNRARPGTINVFEVMLAHKYEQKRIKSWPVAIEPKLDGVRVIAIVDNGEAKFYSRTGKPFTSFDHLASQAVSLVTNAKAFYQNPPPNDRDLGAWYKTIWDTLGGDGASARAVLEGEVVSGSFNKTVSEVRRKSEQATDAVFKVFDVLNLSWFDGSDPSVPQLPYRTRRHIVDDITRAPGAAQVAIDLVPSYYAHDDAEVQEHYGRFREAGFEGAIVKPLEGLYEKKRSYAWLKMKGEESVDVRVVGVFEGTGKYVGMIGGLVVDVDGVEVSVGGGFSDLQREQFWSIWSNEPEELLGRLIEVEYHEKTPDGSLRHPRFVRFRDDKDEKLAA